LRTFSVKRFNISFYMLKYHFNTILAKISQIFNFYPRPFFSYLFFGNKKKGKKIIFSPNFVDSRMLFSLKKSVLKSDLKWESWKFFSLKNNEKYDFLRKKSLIMMLKSWFFNSMYVSPILLFKKKFESNMTFFGFFIQVFHL